jgi:release factor glutamine methyltransferase
VTISARTVGSVRRELAARLQSRWGDDAGERTIALDARLILAHALGVETSQLIIRDEEPVSDATVETAASMIERRLGGEPVARIIGEKEFWSLPFRVSPHTLVPRPDTETLVATAVELIEAAGRRSEPLRLLDLGTGSGCILLAVLSELPWATGLGVDRDQGAIAVATENAERLRLDHRARFVTGNWAEGIVGPFDAILANPPYVEDEALLDLPVEVIGFEPRLALSGGSDGLDGYRAIVPELPRLLAPSGFAVLEFGPRQGSTIAEFAASAGMATEVKRDLAGRDRAALLTISAKDTAIAAKNVLEIRSGPSRV